MAIFDDFSKIPKTWVFYHNLSPKYAYFPVFRPRKIGKVKIAKSAFSANFGKSANFAFWWQIMVENPCFWNFRKIIKNGHFWISDPFSAISRKRAPRGPRWPNFALTYTKFFLFSCSFQVCQKLKMGSKKIGLVT